SGATLSDIGTPASDDQVLILDTSDGLSLKYASADEFGGGGGTGNVTGDSSSVAGNIAVFADTTGKAIEDSGFGIIDEDDMSSDSDTAVPTQQSVKAYVDAATAGGGAGNNDLLLA